MFKILDRYIIRKFLSTYFFAIVALAVIIVVFDMSERIDKFVEKEAPIKAIALDFYGNFVPSMLVQFSGLFTFISIILFTSKMAGHTEFVAMLSTGISFKRIMQPYMLCALFITLLNCYLSNFVIPPGTAKQYDFEEKYIRKPYNNNEKDIHRQVAPGMMLYIENFNVRDQIAYKFSLEYIEDGELKSKLTSSYAKWDTAKNVWHVHNYVKRTILEDKEVIETGTRLDTSISLTGRDFSIRMNKFVETMDFFELNDYIELLERQGSAAVIDAKLEKHKRFAYPMASLILAVIGVTMSCRKVRGGMGLHLGLGIGLSFAYILFQRFSEMFVQGGVLSPAISLWIPNVLFIIVAFFLYRATPK